MTGSRILIVEDEPALMRGLKDTFAGKGAHVLAAADAKTGFFAAGTDPRVDAWAVAR